MGSGSKIGVSPDTGKIEERYRAYQESLLLEQAKMDAALTPDPTEPAEGDAEPGSAAEPEPGTVPDADLPPENADTSDQTLDETADTPDQTADEITDSPNNDGSSAQPDGSAQAEGNGSSDSGGAGEDEQDVPRQAGDTGGTEQSVPDGGAFGTEPQ